MVAAKKDNIIVNVDEAENFILRTKNADYTLDLKQLVSDYGVVYVVDSDKKRINEGDTVYGRSDGKAWHVTGVFGGDYPVWAVDDDGNSRELKPEWLTHKKPEPDSYEKIEKDIILDPQFYCTKWFGQKCALNSIAERKKAEHLVTRCKRLYNDSVKQPNADFNWEAFKNGEIAVNCKTIELAEDFFEAVKNHLYITEYYLDRLIARWDEFKDKTCYAYNEFMHEIKFGDYSYCKKNGYTIVEWGSKNKSRKICAEILMG